jgi:fluoride exporter
MWNYILVGGGGAIGSVLRFWMADVIAKRFGHAFPWGTLFVNVSGSFAIGLFAGLTVPEGRWPVSPGGRAFFMAGICGGYTTFSAFSLQTLTLAQEKQWFSAAANAALNVVLCLAAVWLGHLVAERFSLKGL